jgi:hypothetical protein
LRDFPTIKEVTKNHFEALYIKQEEVDPVSTAIMLENIPHLIFEVENEELVKEIEEGEIIKVIWGLAPDKALGPNGFFIHFFRLVGVSLNLTYKCMLMHVQKKHKLGGITNSSFLALIPKEVNPSMFSRFQPISLCNSS